jgi:Tol biopolymer transport system component
VKDISTGDLILVSTSDARVKGNGFSFESQLSGDGTMAAFTSRATNLDAADTEPLDDVYVKDLDTGELTLVSTSDTGVKGNSSSHSPSLSLDGTVIAFASHATNLDAADPDGHLDVYVKDLSTGDVAVVSTSDSGVPGDRDHSQSPWLSADGTAVAFHSDASNFEPPDNNLAHQDMYVKDLVSGDLTRVSTSDTGCGTTATVSAPVAARCRPTAREWRSTQWRRISTLPTPTGPSTRMSRM